MRKLLSLVALITASMLTVSCSDASEASDVLRKQGYTEIRTGGYSVFGCGRDDGVRTSFVATAPNGERVSGTVCGGFLFKNSTVRLG